MLDRSLDGSSPEFFLFQPAQSPMCKWISRGQPEGHPCGVKSAILHARSIFGHRIPNIPANRKPAAQQEQRHENKQQDTPV
jgi:hypothetical protein